MEMIDKLLAWMDGLPNPLAVIARLDDQWLYLGMFIWFVLCLVVIYKAQNSPGAEDRENDEADYDYEEYLMDEYNPATGYILLDKDISIDIGGNPYGVDLHDHSH